MSEQPAPATGDEAEDDAKPAPTLLEQMGGISGLVYSSVPIVVFVLVNYIFDWQPALWAAVGVAVAIAVLRLVRREPLQPAISGLIGVGVCALVANQTGVPVGRSVVPSRTSPTPCTPGTYGVDGTPK